MTRFDLHPEDLLERAQRGSANDADLARLEQHLAECAVCRVERELSQQATLDVEPLRDEKLMIARLKRDVAERLQTPSRARRRKRGAVLAFSLVAASLASIAAAATVVMVKRDTAPPADRAPAEQAPAPSKPSKPGKVAAPVARPEPVVTPPAAPESADAAPAEQVPKPALAETGSAAEVFSRANQARRDGKVREAARLYRVLQERYSGSGEELVSRVALGRLLLDRLGDGRGALVQFNSYLASPSTGALREEAMVGRALALGRTGRTSEERAAWRALLDAWPKSAHAKRAQARLAELDAKPTAR
jgi:TolA-binding protein